MSDGEILARVRGGQEVAHIAAACRARPRVVLMEIYREARRLAAMGEPVQVIATDLCLEEQDLAAILDRRRPGDDA